MRRSPKRGRAWALSRMRSRSAVWSRAELGLGRHDHAMVTSNITALIQREMELYRM